MPVTTRTRRARALLRSDVQLDVDMVDPEIVNRHRDRDRDRRRRRVNLIEDEPEPEDEDGDGEGSNVDIEAVAEDDEDDGDEDGDVDVVDDDDDDDEDEEDEIHSDVDRDGDEHEHGIPKVMGGLKIRLKLPSRYETPTVESEDSMDSESQPAGAKRPLTSRQAVLANVMDASHVSLGSSRHKKAPLNETELALRREETARKRKNLTEKKLEDEKLETINRLLRKQSRPRKKRNTAQQRPDMDDIAPDVTRGNSSTSAYTISSRSKLKKQKSTKSGARAGAGADEEQYEDENDEEEVVPEDIEEFTAGVEEESAPAEKEVQVQIPRMYRWVSTSRVDAVAEGTPATDADVRTMQVTFSVPTCALPNPETTTTPPLPLLTRPTTCAAPGCGKPFRYRLVKDWTRGACGISCLKQLESAL